MVPVYDLGEGPDGAPFFTMKKVRGSTLAAIVRELRSGDAEAGRSYTRMRLLAAFSTVCLAVDYAHERGVVHRDLKPANIMLGDYGEVYVLDWGLAKLAHNADVDPRERLEVDNLHAAMTHVGTVMGTPGYVAPEQLTAGAVDADRRCDVYSLGAILFEILTWDKLHRPGTVKSVIEATLRGDDLRTSARAPERAVPPELDRICERALARDPDQRFASARDLHDAVQRYLEGQRDVELRRQQSQECARVAATAAAAAAHRGDGDTITSRRVAMREVGRALALDPDNADALQTMVTLLTEPPDQPPPEVER